MVLAKPYRWGVCLLGVFFVWVVSAGAQGESAAVPAPKLEEVHVLDILLVGTNLVQIGTNTLPLVAATNQIKQLREGVDIIAIHGRGGPAHIGEARAGTLEKLARIGVPLVVVEEQEGEFGWRTRSEDDGIRTIRLSTDQFNSVNRVLQGKQGPPKPTAPILQTTIEWDSIAGSYELRKVELGLFNKRTWLVHELGDSDNESGSVGIQFKRVW